MPRSGNMNSVSTKRGKFLGLLRLSKTDFYGVNYIFPLVALRPKADHGLFILEVSISHATTHHSRYGSSILVISSSQRPLPDNTHNRKTSMLQAEFEPTASAEERP
jgi:hypothetical protein